MRAAFRTLLIGFQDADRRSRGAISKGHEKQVHPALVTALLRLVVLLFAHSRGLIRGPISLPELHEKLALDKVCLGNSFGQRYDAWPLVLDLFRFVYESVRPPIAHTHHPSLFDPRATPLLDAPIADDVVLGVLDTLLVSDGKPTPFAELDIEHLGTAYEGLMAFDGVESGLPYDIQKPVGDLRELAGDQRRKLGAHYTSRAITQIVTRRALAPLLTSDPSPEAILALRVCDPSMGSGAFLLEVCRYLGDQLADAWNRTGKTSVGSTESVTSQARCLVAQHCLYGVDKNPRAVELARWSLWLEAAFRAVPANFLESNLRVGDSLVGLMRDRVAGLSVAGADIERQRDAADAHLSILFSASNAKAQARELATLPGLLKAWFASGAAPDLEKRVLDFRARHGSFHWDIEFADVFARGGFDVFVGNPPWVSYAGRAAQPLDDDLRAYYARTNPSFAGYRNLQGMFVWRCATMLRPSGRLGLVLPSSMSELGGYAATRRAHDELCSCDEDLPDFGDVFDDVFQPSMALLSTRLAEARTLETVAPWPLHRADLDAPSINLLARLSSYPKFPPELFGERGFQSMGDDIRHLHVQDGPDERFRTGVRVGGDIEPFLRRPPKLYCDPTMFTSRFRSAEDWQSVRLLIRQTARFPMAALSDGIAFRNSILAGFSSDEWSPFFLLAWLNSTPIRWYHYTQNRDARQGMPQVKIAHLRALPAPTNKSFVRAIEDFGRDLGERNSGITPPEQTRLDGLVAGALELTAEDLRIVSAWSDAMTSKQG